MIIDHRMCLNDVATALSRYDGHSTFARLERILALPLSDEFATGGSVFASQLIRSTIGTQVSELAARRHVDHAVALGLFERVSAGGDMVRVTDAVRKIDVTSRIALTPLARALRAASSLDDSGFREFLLACALLQKDFDMYGLALRLALTPPLRVGSFIDAFRHTVAVRERWIGGLEPAFRSQFAGLVPWLARDLSDTSLKHHFNLRRSWAVSTGHLCPDTLALTQLGKRYATSMRNAASQFWLAPHPDCIQRLRLSPPDFASGPSTSWEMLAPTRNGSAPTVGVLDVVADFMIDAFEHLRMHLFRQAPITAVLPFVHYAKYVFDDPAPPFEILKSVVSRDRIDCMLSRSVETSYYRIRITAT